MLLELARLHVIWTAQDVRHDCRRKFGIFPSLKNARIVGIVLHNNFIVFTIDVAFGLGFVGFFEDLVSRIRVRNKFLLRGGNC
jgi:hypothetical protein